MTARGWVSLAGLMPWALWAVVRMSGIELGFPAPAVLAFTPVVALTAVIPLVLAFVLRQWTMVVVALAVVCALGGAMVGRALPGQGRVDPGRAATGQTLTVMGVNLLQGRAEPAHVMELVRRYRVDVLALQESRPWWVALLDGAGGASWFRHLSQRPNDHALLSRLPMVDLGAGEGIVTLRGGSRVRVQSMHTLPPTRVRRERQWRAELAAVPAANRPGTDPAVLVGDFNATLDHPELRAVIDRGYRDAADTLGKGWTPTWSSGIPLAPHLVLDHVLFDRRLGVESFNVETVRGTDHRAVIAVLRPR